MIQRLLAVTVTANAVKMSNRISTLDKLFVEPQKKVVCPTKLRGIQDYDRVYVMCGRYTLQQPETLQKRFQTNNALEIKSNYNAAPVQTMPIIVGNSSTRIALMR